MYLIKTAEEIDQLAQLFDGGKTVLSDGHSMAQVFGARKIYNKDYRYSVNKLADSLINNPDHIFYGLYFVKVILEDVKKYLPDEVDNLVEYDPTWRLAA